MADTPLLISGAQLEAFTGLSDRRHRQLAKLGYFASPVVGQYRQIETIRGIFKYYREDHNVSTRTLTDAKLQKLKADAEMSRIKVSQAKRETIDRQEVADYLRAWTAKLDLLLTAELENNAPNLVLGRPIDEVRSEMRQMHDRIREATRRGLRAWEDDNPVYDTPKAPDDEDEDETDDE